MTLDGTNANTDNTAVLTPLISPRENFTHAQSAGLRCLRAWTEYDYAHTLKLNGRKRTRNGLEWGKDQSVVAQNIFFTSSFRRMELWQLDSSEVCLRRSNATQSVGVWPTHFF